MLDRAASSLLALDISTMFIVATCVSTLLGTFLLFAWMQDRVRALAWWGCAYLVGGFSVAIWSIESAISPPLPQGFANALLFVSCGMIWSAARLFHGREVLWGALAAGATVWMIASMFPAFVESTAARMLLSSLIVASYTFLTSKELWSERRRHLLRRWPAVFVPILHGGIFLSPVVLSNVLPSDGALMGLTSGWMAVFVLETMLYVVGTAFIGLVMAKEHVVNLHKDAASTDDLTGLLNRRGFLEAAEAMIKQRAPQAEPVSVLMFDLDHFKSINDRFGHGVGDKALRLFGASANASLRTSDILGRLGGEEFAAILPGTVADAAIAAERVRRSFAAAGASLGGCPLDATVSVGVAGGVPGTDMATLLARADAALYRAKNNGRNCVELATDVPVVAAEGTPTAIGWQPKAPMSAPQAA